MKSIKRYIPEIVYDKINKLEYKNKEHLYIVCDMIYRSSIFRKEDKDYSNEFIDIPEYYFSDLIQKHISLKNAKLLLLESSIIESDGIYSKLGGKALGWRFNENCLSKLISVDIESKPISKRIIKNKNERNNLVNENLHSYRNYFIDTFKIDYESAIKYLNDWYNYSILDININFNNGLSPEYIKIINKYNHIFISLSAINDGDLYFRKNSTNGRIDTNLTSLKSEYKKFIISDKDLYQIDIMNSQPFILYLYLNVLLSSNYLSNIEKNELDKYGDWTSSGLFYEMFEREYFKKTGKTLTRKVIKDMMFCIFYSKNGSYTKEKMIFKMVFPFIMGKIEKEKEGKHNEFAIKLQKIESKICIDIICKDLENEDIEYYTIHDAWLVDKRDVKKVTDIIYKNFYKSFYRRPELKIEKIN